jgi:hypothetical protein
MTYPDVCIQNLIDSAWWENYDGPEYRPGRLIRAFLPYVDQNPYRLVPLERGGEDGTQHERALFWLEPLNIKHVSSRSRLPHAPLTERKNEIRAVYRAKKRPAIIIGKSGPKVDKEYTTGKAAYQTQQTVLVAPSYGADEDGRSGYKPELVERIRRCEYPQFMWDLLPIKGQTQESIIRLDQLQPLGKTTTTIEFTNFCLSEEALSYVYEWLEWLMTGTLDEDSKFNEHRDCLLDL